MSKALSITGLACLAVLGMIFVVLDIKAIVFYPGLLFAFLFLIACTGAILTGIVTLWRYLHR